MVWEEFSKGTLCSGPQLPHCPLTAKPRWAPEHVSSGKRCRARVQLFRAAWSLSAGACPLPCGQKRAERCQQDLRWACAGEGASLDFKGPQQELHTWDRGEAALIHVERGGMRGGKRRYKLGEGAMWTERSP